MFLLLVSLASGHTSSIDEETFFRTAEAAFEGHLSVPRPEDRGLNLAKGRGGKEYPYYPPGVALLLLPWLAAGKLLDAAVHLGPYGLRTWCLLLPPALLAAFSAWWRAREGVSMEAVLLFVFGTLLFPWTRTLRAEVPLSLLLASAWILRDEISSGRLGAMIGAALLLRVDAVIWFFGLLLRRCRRGTDIAHAVAGAAPFVVLLAVYNYARFGAPYTTGYPDVAGGVTNAFNTPLLEGIYGLTLSLSRGFVIFAPLSVAGGWLLWRAATARDRVCVGLTWIVPFLFYAKNTAWHGGAGWGPRYLLPGLTVAALGLVHFARLPRAPRRALVAVALSMNLLGILAPIDTHFDRVFEAGRTLREVYLGLHLSPIAGQIETLRNLRWDRLSVSGETWFPGGGGHPWNQNLRYTLDLWPVYTYKLGRSPLFFVLWAASLAGGVLCTILAAAGAAGYRIGHGAHDGPPGAHPVRGEGPSAPR